MINLYYQIQHSIIFVGLKSILFYFNFQCIVIFIFRASNIQFYAQFKKIDFYCNVVCFCINIVYTVYNIKYEQESQLTIYRNNIQHFYIIFYLFSIVENYFNLFYFVLPWYISYHFYIIFYIIQFQFYKIIFQIVIYFLHFLCVLGKHKIGEALKKQIQIKFITNKVYNKNYNSNSNSNSIYIIIESILYFLKKLQQKSSILKKESTVSMIKYRVQLSSIVVSSVDIYSCIITVYACIVFGQTYTLMQLVPIHLSQFLQAQKENLSADNIFQRTESIS
eukprot:TRINITY_DN1009_c5_g1_i1.p1 TRINITY_DN1009_c5_g1~~TRINITY_DN1009_c5_g1_i1.p1  ORF type:complete len:288 (+),score=-18.30 TRINITY_DN1009_c5_g1_i1:33-866(+)